MAAASVLDYIPVTPRPALEGPSQFPDDAPYSAWEAQATRKNGAGITETDLSRVICLPEGRTAEHLKSGHILLLAASIQEAVNYQSSAGRPELVSTIAQAMEAARVSGKTNPEMHLLTVRAILDTAAEYLWKCPDHGGLIHTSSFAIFPFCDIPYETEGEDAPGPSPPTTGSAAGGGTKRARQEDETSLDSLQQAIAAEELTHRTQKAATPLGPAKKKTLATRVSIETQVQTRMGNLTALLPQMENVMEYSEPTQEMMLRTGRQEVEEALRLCRLSPEEFDEEIQDLVYLKEGLKKAATTHQVVMGVLWLRARLLASCDSGIAVDFKKMDEEFATLKKVVGLDKHAPQRAGGIQPVALASVFQGAAFGPPLGMPPAQGFGPPPGFSPHQPQLQSHTQGYGGPRGSYKGGRGSAQYGAPGHYGRGSGGRGGGRGRGYGGQLPFCRKCQQAGSSDIRHSHTVCPLTICFKCQKPGHIRPNCPDP